MLRRGGLSRSSSLGGGGLRRGYKRINNYGRVAQERAARKKKWEAANPPLKNRNSQQYYLCHICLYFKEHVTVAYVKYEDYVLEHKVPKGRISFEESQEDKNLGPSHKFCNTIKGTRELWEMTTSPINNLPNPYPSKELYEEYLLFTGEK